MHARELTHRLRNRLDPAARARLRSAVHAWGRLTWPLRMTPDLIVVGAQRCGTTTLFRLLAEHPHLVRPTAVKGTGYFDDDYVRGPRWYRAHFPVGALVRATRRGRRVHAFECSGYYLFHPLAARRIARDLPGVQVVVLVRDPVERARSAHRHELARGFEWLPFDQAVAQEWARTAGEAERIAAVPAYRSFAHRHHAYLQRGQYDGQIARFVEALGPDRVHVVDADRFFADPVTEFVGLQRRLGLPVWVPDEVGHWNARPAPPADQQDREVLLRRFAESDAALAAHLGHVPSWRAGVGTSEVAS